MEVYAPASIANLGPGFDTFGMAIENFGDTLRLEETREQTITISVEGDETSSIPRDTSSNSAGAVLEKLVKNLTLENGFHVKLRKGVPPGKGMGSSGASAAAAAFAADRLLELSLTRKELVNLAAIGEAAVTGSPHADNVSASLLGGFTIVNREFETLKIEPPEIDIVVVSPDISIERKTMMARSILPESVSLRDAVFNISEASRMAAAVALKDQVLFGKSVCDKLVEPIRAQMIPNFWAVKEAALKAGALGCSIAGGGPSLFAISDEPVQVGKAMARAFSEVNVESTIYYTRPSIRGARMI